VGKKKRTYQKKKEGGGGEGKAEPSPAGEPSLIDACALRVGTARLGRGGEKKGRKNKGNERGRSAWPDFTWSALPENCEG